MTAGTMNLVDRLQDPQLVADFQRLFGVRRKSCKRGVARDASEGQEGSGTSRENLLDRYLGDQRHQNESMTQRRCQQLPVPDVHHKTHIRQGSTASVASDCSTGSGEGVGTIGWLAFAVSLRFFFLFFSYDSTATDR